MKAIVLGIGCALALALGIAGCGGGDDEAPTKAEFTAEANAVCEDSFVRILANLETASAKPDEAARQAAVTATVVPPFEEMVGELAELDPPEENGEEVEAIVAAYEESVEATKQDPAVALEEKGANPYAEAFKLASKFGMNKCAGV